MNKINLDLSKIGNFLEREESNDVITIEKDDNNKLIIKNENNEPIKSIKIKDLRNDIYFFPILKKTMHFKGVQDLPKTEYVFFFLFEVDDDNILIFSNDILNYIEKIRKKDSNKIKKIKLQDFEKLTSSFYLFSKQEGDNNLYKWKSILSFFSTFFYIALNSNENKSLIHKIKGDNVAFFKSRYMQEKSIKTLIQDKEKGKNFINAMFYGNLLKNLTFKIDDILLDLNGRGKGGFNISTLKNDEKYFKKVKSVLYKINNENISNIEQLPVFFLEGNLGKENCNDMKDYIFIDMFPRVFKNDKKGNTYILMPKNNNEDKGLDIEINIKDFFYGENHNCKSLDEHKSQIKEEDMINSEFIIYKDKIINNFQYEYLNEDESNEVVEYDKKNINVDDLFLLFSHKETGELFLGKIKNDALEQELLIRTKDKEISLGFFENPYGEKEKIINFLEKKSDKVSETIKKKLKGNKACKENIICKSAEEKNKKYYIESYKLYISVGDFNLKEKIRLNKFENNENEIIFFQNNDNKVYKEEDDKTTINEKKVFGFIYKDNKKSKELSFLIDEKNNGNGLTYFFNGASLKNEDLISLGLIAQLNNGKINIGNKKTKKGELADIIGINKEGDESTIHLIHIKSSPFIINGNIDTYSYYTTAIGQMLQKIEPILMGNAKKFFDDDNTIDKIKESIKEKLDIKKENFNETLSINEDFKLFDVNKDFLKKIEDSKKIKLKIGVAILEKQLEGDINNNVFFMVENLLLNGFEHTIKPFLNKEIDIIFYPIVIKN